MTLSHSPPPPLSNFADRGARYSGLFVHIIKKRADPEVTADGRDKASFVLGGATGRK